MHTLDFLLSARPQAHKEHVLICDTTLKNLVPATNLRIVGEAHDHTNFDGHHNEKYQSLASVSSKLS